MISSTILCLLAVTYTKNKVPRFYPTIEKLAPLA